MLKYTVKRVLLAVVTVFIISAITFFAMNAIPGGPFAKEKAPDPAVQAALEARFNLDKAKWYNREYLRMKPTEELAMLFLNVLDENEVEGERMDYIMKVIDLVKDRATFVRDLWTASKPLFVAPETFDEKDVAKFWKTDNYEYAFEVCQWVTGANFGFDDLDPYYGSMEKDRLEPALEGYIRMRGYPMGKVMNCLRLALTGAASGLPIADIISLIGRKEFASRMTYAANTLGRL